MYPILLNLTITSSSIRWFKNPLHFLIFLDDISQTDKQLRGGLFAEFQDGWKGEISKTAKNLHLNPFRRCSHIE